MTVQERLGLWALEEAAALAREVARFAPPEMVPEMEVFLEGEWKPACFIRVRRAA